MGFNNFVNAFIVFSGILEFLAFFGGISFLIYYLHYHLLPTEEEPEQKCGDCKGFQTCYDLMNGCLPDSACAYWEEKKL